MFEGLPLPDHPQSSSSKPGEVSQAIHSGSESADLSWTEEQIVMVLRKMRPGPLTSQLRSEDSLFEMGVLDSLGLIQLIQLLEQRFSIGIDYTKVRFESFQNARNIALFLVSECGLKAKPID